MELGLSVRAVDYFAVARAERVRADAARRAHYVDLVVITSTSSSTAAARRVLRAALVFDGVDVDSEDDDAAGPTAAVAAPAWRSDALRAVLKLAPCPLARRATVSMPAGELPRLAAARGMRETMLATDPPRMELRSSTHAAQWRCALLEFVDATPAPQPAATALNESPALALRRLELRRTAHRALSPAAVAPLDVATAPVRPSVRMVGEGTSDALAPLLAESPSHLAMRVLTDVLAASLSSDDAAASDPTKDPAQTWSRASAAQVRATLAVASIRRTPVVERAVSTVARARSVGTHRDARSAIRLLSVDEDTRVPPRTLARRATRRAAKFLSRSLTVEEGDGAEEPPPVAPWRGGLITVAAAATRALRFARTPKGIVAPHCGQGALCMLSIAPPPPQKHALIHERWARRGAARMEAIASIDVEPRACFCDFAYADAASQFRASSYLGAFASDCSAGGVSPVAAPVLFDPQLSVTARIELYPPSPAASRTASPASRSATPHDRRPSVTEERAHKGDALAASPSPSMEVYEPPPALDRVALYLQLRPDAQRQYPLPRRAAPIAAATPTASSAPTSAEKAPQLAERVPADHAPTSEKALVTALLEQAVRDLVVACPLASIEVVGVMVQLALAKGRPFVGAMDTELVTNLTAPQCVALERRFRVVIQEMLRPDSRGSYNEAVCSQVLALHALVKALSVVTAAKDVVDNLERVLESAKYAQLLRPGERALIDGVVRDVERVQTEKLVIAVFASEPFIQRIKVLGALRMARVECYDRDLAYPLSLVVDERTALCVVPLRALGAVERSGRMPLVAALCAIEHRFERIVVVVDTFSSASASIAAASTLARGAGPEQGEAAAESASCAVAALIARRRGARFAITYACGDADIAAEVAGVARRSLARAHDGSEASRWPRALEFHRRAWLEEDESAAESFLSSIPSLSAFCASAILTQMSAGEFLAISLDDKRARLPWLPRSVIDAAHALLCGAGVG